MIRIREVTSRSDLRRFVHFPNALYRDNEYYIPQIESIEIETLSQIKNAVFEACEVRYWLAIDEFGNIVGRVAGSINHRYDLKINKRICRFGWLDFIDSQEVVNSLMSEVEKYAVEKGMEMIEGPVGFLEFDVSGILVDGFDRTPTIYGKYNYRYYDTRLLASDFNCGSDYVEYLIKVPKDLELYHKYAGIIQNRYGLHEGKYRNKKELIRKYSNGIFMVVNQVYSRNHCFSELSVGQREILKRKFLHYLVLDYVSVIVDHEDKVVGFGVAMPSLTKALKKVNGHIFPFGWFYIIRSLYLNDSVDLLLIAVSDEYRNKGVNTMIMSKIADALHDNGIGFVESSRELENNYYVQDLWAGMEHRIIRRRRTYTKSL